MGAIHQALLGEFGASSTGDPYFSSVSALLHMNGSNASTTFTDVTGKSWTANGNAQISTAQSQWGGASGLFDGTGDYITTASHADFGMGTGDYTLELWVNPSVVTGDHCVLDLRSGSATGIAIYTSLSSFSNRWGAADNSNAIGGGANLASSAWTHIALVRQGTTIRFYTNGVQSGTSADSRTYASSVTARIGTDYTGGGGYNGYADDVRITKGVCRYPNGTTFSVPTAAFPDS